MSQTLSPATETIRRHRFTADEYLKMAEGGFLRSNRVELINGDILDMPPQHNSHAFGVSAALEALQRVFPGEHFWVRPQMTLRLGDHLPDPDVTVVPGRKSKGKVIPTSALLVVEVSDSTLDFDLGEKADMYAAGGITDYWVVDIVSNRILIHRDSRPNGDSVSGARYESVIAVSSAGTLTPLAAPRAVVLAIEILG